MKPNERLFEVSHRLGELCCHIAWLKEEAARLAPVDDGVLEVAMHYGAPCATPVREFPHAIIDARQDLDRIRRVNQKLADRLDRAMTSLMNMVGNEFPCVHDLRAKGQFWIGFHFARASLLKSRDN